MGQRMVMDTRFMTLKELKMYVEEAEKIGLPLSSAPGVTSYEVEQEVEEGQEPLPPRVYFRFSVTIPESKRRRFVTVKKKTKTEKAVEEQIETHKKEVKEGKKVAHVPPVKGTVKRKPKKKRRSPAEVEQDTIDANNALHEKSYAEEDALALTEEDAPHPRRKKSKKNTSAYKTDKTEGNADV